MKPFWILALAACSADAPGDVVGPYTGETRRFVVDSLDLPRDPEAFGDDLDGDGAVDNQFGSIYRVLAGQSDVTLNAADQIASGAIASTVEILADDFDSDGTVAVTYFGVDGARATAMGGRFESGVLQSNRTRETRVPGDAVVVLPVFRDADPSVVDIVGLQIELVPDGAGGYRGTLSGGIPRESAAVAAFDGITAMIQADTIHHRQFMSLVDANGDGTFTRDEYDRNGLFIALTTPDLDLFDGAGNYAPRSAPGGAESLSVAFRFHLTPCESGRCTSPPADPCHDRIRDGTEPAIDCGGSCALGCAPGVACALDSDCQTGSCDADVCAAASCSDGVHDGFEADVDCGGPCTAKCQLGQRCDFGSDCETLQCDPIGRRCGQPML